MSFTKEVKKKKSNKMRFRTLDTDELLALEKEFVDFLVSNTITADDWIKIKEDSVEKAEELIDLFSDVVFEKVLQKVEYADVINEKNMMLFHFTDQETKMIGLNVQEGIEIDLSNMDSIAQLLENGVDLTEVLSFFKVAKSYDRLKEDEIFDILESGALMSDGRLFNILKDLDA